MAAILENPIRKLELVSVPIKLVSNEQATYQEGTITNGYGSCSGVYVTVQKGTSADINVDFEITSISIEQFNQWKSEVQQYFSADQYHELNEKYGSEGCMGGFFAGCFGMLFGGNDSTHYMNTKDTYKTEGDQKCEGFAKTTYNLQVSTFEVKGDLKAVGTSFIPATVSAYVQITKIVFADGKELNVINTDDPAVADKNGNTSGAKVNSSNLYIVPKN